MAHHHKHHRRHRRRNPFGFDKHTLLFAGEAVLGGVGTLAIPAAVLPSMNDGIKGYGLNIVTSLGLKFLGDLGSKQLGDAFFAGGLVATGLRIVKDQLPGILPMGAYWESYFAVPPISNSFGQTLKSPYPMPALPAPTMKGAGRLAARF